MYIEENPGSLPPSSCGLHPPYRQIPESEFNAKRGVWNPMLELTILPQLISYIVENGVQLSTPAQTNANKSFPLYSEMEQQITIGKDKGEGKGFGVEFTYVLG
jgi:hypothetical protein